MSVLAHKLTYRWWYPWLHFNPFQTVCLHQRIWYCLWDQASSKWLTPAECQSSAKGLHIWDSLLQSQFSWGFNVRLSFIVSQNDSRMVVIKAPVQPAPAVHSFFVMVYKYVLCMDCTALWCVMWVYCISTLYTNYEQEICFVCECLGVSKVVWIPCLSLPFSVRSI